MSETVFVRFVIIDGVIIRAIETHKGAGPSVLTERGDIEDAVARVANTPVGGKINEEK